MAAFDQDISGNMAKKRLCNQTDSLMACISQSTGLVSINDLDPLFTILEVEGPNGPEQSCLCVCVSVWVRETETLRVRKPPMTVLQLDEVLVCDSWGRWFNLSFIRPY